MKPADELKRRAELGIEPIRALDPGPLDYMAERNEAKHRAWRTRWSCHNLRRNLQQFARKLRGLPADG